MPWAQAQILAYSQIRDMEENPEPKGVKSTPTPPSRGRRPRKGRRR